MNVQLGTYFTSVEAVEDMGNGHPGQQHEKSSLENAKTGQTGGRCMEGHGFNNENES